MYVPADDVARTLAGSITAVGKPSTEATNTSVVEMRARSTSAVDAMVIAKAFQAAYEDYLELPEATVEASIERAGQARDQTAGRCEELRRMGKATELAEAELRLQEQITELSILKLKHRVGEFDVVVLEQPEKVKVVEGR